MGNGNIPRLPDQANEVKALFIAQFERGDVHVREIDDIGGIVMTAAEMKAIASGNPQVRRKFQVESELARLDLLAVAANDTRRRMHTRIREIEAHCDGARATQSLLRAACAAVEAATTPDFHANVASTLGELPLVTVTKRGQAGVVVRDLALAVCQLHGITQLERHELWRGSSVQRVVLAAYRGLLLECVVGRFDQAALMLALPGGRGEAALIPETTLAAATERGIFDSADAAIRQFGERMSEIDRRIEQLETERRSILTAIDQPWEHEVVYRALCEERDALLQGLAPKDAANNTMASNDPPAFDAATPAASAEQVDMAIAAPSMVAPPVVLPPLRAPWQCRRRASASRRWTASARRRYRRSTNERSGRATNDTSPSSSPGLWGKPSLRMCVVSTGQPAPLYLVMSPPYDSLAAEETHPMLSEYWTSPPSSSASSAKRRSRHCSP
jgi:hypothetical protein